MGDVVEQEYNDNMKTVKGIGLFKITYEMDVQGSSRDQHYVAGVIAYTSKEAIDTLSDFATKRVKGYKGMKVEQVSFDGLCHAMSVNVQEAVLKTAILEGRAVRKEDYDTLLSEGKKEVKKTLKKRIIPKSKK